MASHMARIVAPSIRTPRSLLTSPAIPHILVPHSSIGGSSRSSYRSRPRHLEPIIAIFPGASVFAIARSPDYVHHLASGHEVNRFATVLGTTYQVCHEFLERRPYHRVAI